jgi:hypothetical protein
MRFCWVQIDTNAKRSQIAKGTLSGVPASAEWNSALALANGGYRAAVTGTGDRGRSTVKTRPLPGILDA